MKPFRTFLMPAKTSTAMGREIFPLRYFCSGSAYLFCQDACLSLYSGAFSNSGNLRRNKANHGRSGCRSTFYACCRSCLPISNSLLLFLQSRLTPWLQSFAQGRLIFMSTPHLTIHTKVSAVSIRCSKHHPTCDHRAVKQSV